MTRNPAITPHPGDTLENNVVEQLFAEEGIQYVTFRNNPEPIELSSLHTVLLSYWQDMWAHLLESKQ